MLSIAQRPTLPSRQRRASSTTGRFRTHPGSGAGGADMSDGLRYILVMKPILTYLDNNVLSKLAAGMLPYLFEQLTSQNLVGCYSIAGIIDSLNAEKREEIVAVLDELRCIFLEQSPDTRQVIPTGHSAELTFESYGAYLQNFDAMLKAQDELNLHGLAGSTAISLQEIESDFTRAFDELIELHNGPNSPNYETLKRSYMSALNVEHHVAEDESRVKILHEFFPSGFHPNAIRPPNIIDQFAQRVPQSIRAKFESLFCGSDSLYDDCFCSAMNLSQLGFGRDRRVRNSSALKARKGARSDNIDYHHIAYGLHADLFMTADKASAKRAYAIKEFHSLQCDVVLIGSDDLCFTLDDETWM
jgi:hypothetical protein